MLLLTVDEAEIRNKVRPIAAYIAYELTGNGLMKSSLDGGRYRHAPRD
jgi:hypothetical protein